MDKKTKLQLSLSRLSAAIESLMEMSNGKEVKSSTINTEIVKKYKTTVVLVSYLVSLGYLKKQQRGLYTWRADAPPHTPLQIAEIVTQRNRDNAKEWTKNKKKQIQKSTAKTDSNNSVSTEVKTKRNVIDLLKKTTEKSPLENAFHALNQITEQERIKVCAFYLKNAGYKIMQPITEYKEL